MLNAFTLSQLLKTALLFGSVHSSNTFSLKVDVKQSTTTAENKMEKRFKRMDKSKKVVKSFSVEQADSQAIYACSNCLTDIFLEDAIIFYLSKDNAYFILQKVAINFTSENLTHIDCINCNSYLGKVVYHYKREDNELRLTGITPKYLFR